MASLYKTGLFPQKDQARYETLILENPPTSTPAARS